MKNLFYAVFTICLLIVGMVNPLSSQSNDKNLKIIISKEIRQADGSVVTKTIIKEGEAAQNFDLDDYLEENKEGAMSLNIEIGTDEVTIQRTKSCQSKNLCKPNSTCKTPKGFLGVSPINDNESREGAVVSIIKNSSAEKAGMQMGDRIIQIDDTRIDDFDDISDFMSKTKQGQEIKVTFEREGTVQTLSIAVGIRNNKNSDNHWGSWDNKNFDFNFDFDINDARISKEACLGVYSSANRANGIEGSLISDFTDGSAAQAAGLIRSDVITAVNGVEVEGHNDLWDEIAKYKAEDVVKVDYVRDGQANSLSVRLNPCEGKTETNIRINEPRRQRRVISEVIVIKKIDDNATSERTENNAVPQRDRSLNLISYKAFPNPTDGLVNVEFEAAAEPIIVSLYDLAGRQLFSEEVNSFDGFYTRQFDLSAYMTSTVVLAVQQGEQLFTEQILVSRN